MERDRNDDRGGSLGQNTKLRDLITLKNRQCRSESRKGKKPQGDPSECVCEYLISKVVQYPVVTH